jgi:bifunctional DNA-binding transcriptional regulator/antitoxin component of YhaV-PrlF toxin-antitoxin module
MSLVVREGSVPIPEEIAAEFGLREGTPVAGERTEDGRLTLRPALTRQEAAKRLRGMGRAWLKPGESGVEEFLKWRQEERELDETYHQWP